jgi:hypothetical protein
VWRDVGLAARLDETLGVVCLVGTDRHTLAGRCDVAQYLRGNAALGRTVGSAGLHVDHQTMPVVGQASAWGSTSGPPKFDTFPAF